MRNGDFSGATLHRRDPLTGQPFPSNSIPASRIHPSARSVMDFFYPLPNLTPLANGFGRVSDGDHAGDQAAALRRARRSRVQREQLGVRALQLAGTRSARSAREPAVSRARLPEPRHPGPHAAPAAGRRSSAARSSTSSAPASTRTAPTAGASSTRDSSPSSSGWKSPRTDASVSAIRRSASRARIRRRSSATCGRTCCATSRRNRSRSATPRRWSRAATR